MTTGDPMQTCLYCGLLYYVVTGHRCDHSKTQGEIHLHNDSLIIKELKADIERLKKELADLHRRHT